MTKNEIVVSKLTDEVLQTVPVLYEGKYRIPAGNLSEHGRKIIYPLIKILFLELGTMFVFENICLEINFAKPKI